jgi:hypothetical protein
MWYQMMLLGGNQLADGMGWRKQEIFTHMYSAFVGMAERLDSEERSPRKLKHGLSRIVVSK